VCSLDAIAADARDGCAADPTHGPLLVVTDARRREVYWAAYDGRGRRVDGPHVQPPAELAARARALGAAAAAGAAAGLIGVPVRLPESPSPAGLAAVAAPALRAGEAPGPLEPLYLRRPDAVEPGARKRVIA
jgi:tRNA threonylcarbamoyladenosine biosynthesis protein TsaB